MKLNNELPGLPDWPPIRLVKEKMEYVVGGSHLSYPRYDAGRKTIGMLLLGAILVSLAIGFTISPTLGTLLAVLCFASMPILTWFPIAKFLCERIFSIDVQVRFTRKWMFVNNQKYETGTGIPVQFRAQRSPLSDEQIERNEELRQKGKLPKSRAYDYKFRKVELIYGSKIVLITSVADEDRAAQFAIALQVGYDLSQANDIGTDLAAPTGPATKENLPE